MPVHTAHIRNLIPHSHLLEFHPKDGWEPLCKFLGKDVPNQPFPFVNQGRNAANLIKIGIVVWAVKKCLPYVVAVGVLWVALKWGAGSQRI